MDKKLLYNLLGRYLDNTCTPEESKLIDDWLELLQEDKSFTAYTKADLDSIHNRIWQKIQENTYQTKETEKPVPKLSRVIQFSKWAVAASIAGVIIFAGFRLTQKKGIEEQMDFAAIVPKQGMLKQTNTTAASVKVVLEDSSVVVLEPGAILNYPSHFTADKREVYLEGKAFFDVSKNARRPFFIYHNNLVTHVLGTSFIIDTKKQNKEAEVSVITGRVEVSENENMTGNHKAATHNGVILTPNQKVIYAVESRQFISSIVDKPLPLNTKSPESFDFESTEITKVLAAVSAAYAIEIVSANDYINKCTFTGNIENGDLYAKLDVICKAINSSYEIKGTKVLIKGPGCE